MQKPLFKSVALALVCVLALAPSVAFAEWPVADMGAYKYLSEAVKQMSEQLEQVRAMKEGTFGRLEEINKQVSGQFSGLKGVYDQLNSAQKDIQGIYGSVSGIRPPTTLQEAAQKWSTLKDYGKGTVGSGKVLDETFKDPRAGGKDDIKYLNRQYDMRQNALKSSIQTAEELLQGVPKRLENVDKLIEAGSKVTTTAEKLDVTNAILAELLRVTTIYMSTLIQFEQAHALMQYTGVDPKAMQQRESILWPVKKAVDAATGAAPSGSGDDFGDIPEGAKKYGVDSGHPETLKGRNISGEMAAKVKL